MSCYCNGIYCKVDRSMHNFQRERERERVNEINKITLNMLVSHSKKVCFVFSCFFPPSCSKQLFRVNIIDKCRCLLYSYSLRTRFLRSHVGFFFTTNETKRVHFMWACMAFGINVVTIFSHI